jgi:hypothetical protein
VTDAQIETFRKKRWAKGEKHYRPEGGPFVGDPMVEYVDEQLDALNYLDVAFVRAKLANDEKQMQVLNALAYLSRQALYLIEVATSEIVTRDSKLVLPN